MMTTQNHIRINDHRFSVFQSGHGEKIFLFHCSAANHNIWNPLNEVLCREFETVCPDFLGYGDSSEFNHDTTSYSPDLEMASELLCQQNEPVHVVGHSYGGAIALMAAIRHHKKVASLTLIEPICFNELPAFPDQQYARQLNTLTTRITSHLECNQPQHAAKEFVHYWQSSYDWWFMSSQRRQKMAQAMPKVHYEFQCFQSIPSLSDEDFSRLTMPVHLLKGGQTKAIANALVDHLQSRLPHAELSIIESAGHLLPITHPEPTFEVLANWFKKIGDRSRCVEVLQQYCVANYSVAFSH